MVQQFTLASSTASYNRVSGGFNPIQLSDGTLAFIYESSSNVWTLAYTTDRVTVNTIAVLDTTTGFDPPSPSFALACDASDNLYVMGMQNGYTSRHAYQGFTKGTGHTWTPSAISTMSTTLSNARGYDMVWCNAGTNGGYLLVHASASGSNGGLLLTLGAGPVLAGTATTYLSAYSTGIGYASSTKFSAALAQDGFGSTAFFVAGPDATSSSQIKMGSGSVASTGTITLSAGNTYAQLLAGGGNKLRVLRYAPGAWVVIYPNSTNSKPTAYAWQNATTAIAGPTSASAGSSLNNLAWDAFVDPSTPNRIVVVMVGGGGVVTTLGATISGGAITWESAVTTIDTWSPVNSGVDAVAGVRHPTVQQVDFYGSVVTDQTPTRALYGDNISFIPPIPDSVGVLIG